MNKLVSVVIPARNEENNICKIIKFLKSREIVDQIIVVDNASTDNTYNLAKKMNVDVTKCNNQGKGYAMEEGLKLVRNEVVLFVDADVDSYFENMIELLGNPIINNEVDFVKSTFEREKGGLVTQMTVKPMLNAFYPNIYKFSEPISGMIASRKEIFESLEFEKDYGVDIGILLDVISKGYRIKEVNIGKIENGSHINKTTDRMIRMSSEIINAVAKRVKKD